MFDRGAKLFFFVRSGRQSAENSEFREQSVLTLRSL